MMARDIVKTNTESKKTITVDQQVMSIVRTVLERCKKEKNSNCLQVPLEDCYERVSFYTGLPKMFIYHLADNNPYREDSFSDDDLIILMECINKFLSEQKYLSFPDLHQEFLKSIKLVRANTKYSPDIKTFENKIYSLGYKYKKNLKGPPLILIEDPEQKFQRFNYLTKIKKYRSEGRQIYYVDEKNILTLPFQNPIDSHNSSKPKQEGTIFFHLISRDAYENGIYISRDKDVSLEELFKKWMFDIVLHSIKPGSVIVMANNFIHGLQPTRPMTRYHSKTRMLQWLRERDVPCDSNMNKPTLYELIEKCTINHEDYDIDRVFKVHGHQVLRLPRNFSSLNPTYFLWNFINKNLMSSPLSKQIVNNRRFPTALENIRIFLLDYIKSIEQEVWSTFFYHSSTMEDQILKLDLSTEELLENNCELDERSLSECTSFLNVYDFVRN